MPRQLVVVVSTSLALACLLTAPLLSASDIVRLQIGPSAVQWLPTIESAGWTLTVAGPDGTVESRWFSARATPTLSHFDQAGQPLADGSYTWELRSIPRPGMKGEVQSGSFRILAGVVLAGGEKEPAERGSVAKDQMVPDDLIVDGKGCIGLGCAPGEGFGGEALRLKQSVVRLRFEDTSATAGFPARDWQLTVNDAGSGGVDRFSIEDLTGGTTPLTVRGGAPSNALYVNGLGNLGLGTATPAVPLHVSRNTGGLANLLRLTNNGGIQFLLERTDGNDWQFSNFNQSFQISVPGSPVGQLNLVDNGDLQIANRVFAVNFIPTSSRETKDDFRPVDEREILARLTAMPVTEWSFRSDPEMRRHIGPVAEDFQAAFGLGQEGPGLSLTDVNGVTIAAVKGLHAMVGEQRQVIEQQQQLIRQLEERLARLEAEK